jgi:DNA mismatch endonuclease (patch repair protein)
MRGNRRADTRPEVALRSALHRLGLRFRKDHPVAAGEVRVKVDIVFTPAGLAVFVDGCYWHSCPEHGHVPSANAQYWPAKLARNRERDRRVDDALTRAGWTVLRVWEHMTVDDAVRDVLNALRASGARRPTGARQGR